MPTYMDLNKNGRMPKNTKKRYNRNDDGDNEDDDDDMSVGTTYNEEEESSIESINESADEFLSELEVMLMSKKPNEDPKIKKQGGRIRKKKKNPFGNPEAKIKKSKFEFPYEAMDVSDGEEEMNNVEGSKCRKCKMNVNSLRKRLFEIKKRDTKEKRKKKIKKRRRKKDAPVVKAERKSGKNKSHARPKGKSRRKSGNSTREKATTQRSSFSAKSRNEVEQNTIKQTVQKENKTGDNSNNYGISNSDKKTNAGGDTTNINKEKPIANEKKASTMLNKDGGRSEIKAKPTKEDIKKEGNKDSKTAEKVEDVSKKADREEAKNVNKTTASITLGNPPSVRTRRSKTHVKKILRMTSGRDRRRSRHLSISK